MSGRRAAENTNTTPNDAARPESELRRPLWLTIDEANVHGLLDEWDAAPASPAEAVLNVLDDVYGNDYISANLNARNHVLAALGLRRQDNPTPGAPAGG